MAMMTMFCREGTWGTKSWIRPLESLAPPPHGYRADSH